MCSNAVECALHYYLGDLLCLLIYYFQNTKPNFSFQQSPELKHEVVLRREYFEIEQSVADEITLINDLMGDSIHPVVPLPIVTGKILSKVIEYCKRHAEAKDSFADGDAHNDDLKEFDAEFVKIDRETLFDLVLAANYLKIQNLLDLVCGAVADMIKGKSPQEISQTFNFEIAFTPEEEADIRRENLWAFDD